MIPQEFFQTQTHMSAFPLHFKLKAKDSFS